MITKRFTINTLDGSIDLRDNNEVMTYKQVVDLLNELHEENILLLRKNGVMEEEIECLSEENKQLKYHLDRTEKELQEYKDFMSLG